MDSERKDPLDYDELKEKSHVYMESQMILDLEYVKKILGGCQNPRYIGSSKTTRLTFCIYFTFC